MVESWEQNNRLPFPSLPDSRSFLDSGGMMVAGTQQQLDEDQQWAANDECLRQRYSGQVIVVYQRQVWGAGQSLAAAWENAQSQPGCPPQDDVAFVPIPILVAEPGSAYAWCLTDPDIQDRFGGLIAAITGDKIWGGGYTHAEAWQDAQFQPGCPPVSEVTFALIPAVQGNETV
jgi:hypothetical protein